MTAKAETQPKHQSLILVIDIRLSPHSPTHLRSRLNGSATTNAHLPSIYPGAALHLGVPGNLPGAEKIWRNQYVQSRPRSPLPPPLLPPPLGFCFFLFLFCALYKLT